MKLLIVAMSRSIHTARWINQISDQGWEIHLFPSLGDGRVHPDMRNVIVHHSIYGRKTNCDSSIKFRGIPVYSNQLAQLLRFVLFKKFPNFKALLLKRLIKRIKPDIIHSLEIQAAGYLILKTKINFKGTFPPWIVTNWGSDIFLFGRLKEHIPKINAVLANCDYYSCECNRDVDIARKLGYKEKVLPVFPNAGGFDLDLVKSLRQPGKTSERRVIMVKGYQGWSGRAIVGLRALELCKDILDGYEIIIYSPSNDILIPSELLSNTVGIAVKVIPHGTAHKRILQLHGKARISIGLSISDAISTSLLEAIVMGSFPIQSWTSCANEWIIDGKTCILVDPMEPQMVADAIRMALTDDDLVNNAAIENSNLTDHRLEINFLKRKAINFYQSVFDK